jgi:hypothetical protein
MQEKKRSPLHCEACYYPHTAAHEPGHRCQRDAHTLVSFGFSSTFRLIMCEEHALETHSLFGSALVSIRRFDPKKGDPRI